MARRRFLLLAFTSFVALGMPGAAQGVAWPAMATDLNRDVGDLGMLIFANLIGYFAASLGRHAVAARIGAGHTLVGSALLGAAALTGFATAQAWLPLLGAAMLIGAWGGTLDTAINAHLALHHGTRAMGLLHASFGVGSTLGPVTVAWLLAIDGSWRWAFGLFAVVQLAMAVAFWFTTPHWTLPVEPVTHREPWRPLLRVVIPILVAFLLISGLELAAGQWASSLLSIGRGTSESTAAAVVAAYWACFTLGRLAMGVAGHLTTPTRLVRWGVATTLVGTVALWWSPHVAVGAGGLLVMGAGLAPLFPVFMLMTPLAVGQRRASLTVGYQLAAATVGIAVLPAGLGVPVNRWGVDSIPPFLVAAAVLLAWVTASSLRRISSGENPHLR
jgi:fucose permease